MIMEKQCGAREWAQPLREHSYSLLLVLNEVEQYLMRIQTHTIVVPGWPWVWKGSVEQGPR